MQKVFGMQILIYDPYIKKIPSNVKSFEKIEYLINNSDIITLHLPLNKSTVNLIDEAQFNYFKKNSFLINTSRGEIINSKFLIRALEEKRISGAALDVIDDELDFINSGFNDLVEYSSSHDNLIITLILVELHMRVYKRLTYM